MWIKQQKLISSCSGGWKSKGKSLSVSGEGSLPGLQMAAFLLHPHMAFGLGVCAEGKQEQEREFSGDSSHKDTNAS